MAASVTITPSRGCVGTTVTMAGSGFAPSSPLLVFYGNDFFIEGAPAETQPDGSFSFAFPLPNVALGAHTVEVQDGGGNLAFSTFTLCCPIHADGVDTTGASFFFGPHIVGTGVHLLDYIFHDGGHWVVWETGQPAWAGNAAPATNPTLTVARVDAVTQALTTYTVDTDVCWRFDDSADTFLFGPGGNWRQRFWFAGFSKPVLDVKFASDGATLWLAVLTKKTVVYPYITSDDGHGFPNQAAQFATLASFTSGFTYFPRSDGDAAAHDPTFIRIIHNADGVLNIYAPVFANSDAGEHWSGYWTIPNVVVFAGGVGGFAKIGEENAKYYPGAVAAAGNDTAGVGGPRRYQSVADSGSSIGSFLSPLAVCASAAEPGVMHLVYGEGGVYGRYGAGSGSTPAVWDGGPANQSYRMSYQRWSAGGQVLSDDFATLTIDRTSDHFPFQAQGPSDTNDYQCGPQYAAALPVTNVVALRNDSGRPVMLSASLLTKIGLIPGAGVSPDAHGHPWLGYSADKASVALGLYDLSGGGPSLLQALPAGLMPQPADFALEFSGGPFGPANRIRYDWPSFDVFGYLAARGFALSFVYDDDETGPSYIVGLPLDYVVNSTTDTSVVDVGPFLGFYRVPADGSGPFTFVDGLDGTDFRRYNYIFVRPTGDIGVSPDAGIDFAADLWNDPRNVWSPPGINVGVFPFSSGLGQLDRACVKGWTLPHRTPNATAAMPSWAIRLGTSSYYDKAADVFYWASADGSGFYRIARVPLCRYCFDCSCGIGPGVHVSKRVTWGSGV